MMIKRLRHSLGPSMGTMGRKSFHHDQDIDKTKQDDHMLSLSDNKRNVGMGKSLVFEPKWDDEEMGACIGNHSRTERVS